MTTNNNNIAHNTNNRNNNNAGGNNGGHHEGIVVKTAIPGITDINGNQRYDVTPIPSTVEVDETVMTTQTENNSLLTSSRPNSPREDDDDDDNDNNDQISTCDSTKQMNQLKKNVSKDEKSLQKKFIRFISGISMISSFLFILYAGHIYACGLVALLQTLLFKELVSVRYNAYFNKIQHTIPLFRTTQWCWFIVATFYTYGDFVSELIKSNKSLHDPFQVYVQVYYPVFSFFLYSSIFVLTISTMQPGHIKFQLNQLCWTIVVLCITIGQTRYMMHNIYNGLFWFTLPALLVITNDIWAYICGVTCGRKFIQRPFITFSPNKTWEGFIGGGIFTLIFAWYLSRWLIQYTWMTCPTNKITLNFHSDEFYNDCNDFFVKDHIFEESYNKIPSQIFEILPNNLVRMIPGIKEICVLKNITTTSTDDVMVTDQQLQQQPCISGDETQVHHHFELLIKNIYPVQIHALAIGLFASIVAPFGGFLASAIKRAYGLKNFNSIIPGHGGIMDRMDCQFLMALYTWVHYNTFVKMAYVSVPKLIYMYNLMNDNEKEIFLQQITNNSTTILSNSNTCSDK